MSWGRSCVQEVGTAGSQVTSRGLPEWPRALPPRALPLRGPLSPLRSALGPGARALPSWPRPSPTPTTARARVSQQVALGGLQGRTPACGAWSPGTGTPPSQRSGAGSTPPEVLHGDVAAMGPPCMPGVLVSLGSWGRLGAGRPRPQEEAWRRQGVTSCPRGPCWPQTLRNCTWSHPAKGSGPLLSPLPLWGQCPQGPGWKGLLSARGKQPCPARPAGRAQPGPKPGSCVPAQLSRAPRLLLGVEAQTS